jgi:glycosyltransferase involved in cell wall biosynthesis
MSEHVPFFSVLTPVYDPPLAALSAAIESVRAQTFHDWELILVDDASPSQAVRDLLAQAAAGDERITVIDRAANGGIVASSNDAIGVARGRFLALVDHDGVIVPQALERVHAVLAESPNADYVYSDEDKLDAEGELYEEFRKPDWSPERLRGQMYTCHLSILRTSVVRDVGGFRTGYDGAQDHDLVLRVTERARRVVHVREVLYHWRVVPDSAAGDTDAKPSAWVAGCRAVQDQLDRLGIAGTVFYGRVPGTYRIERVADPQTSVSVIIPTRGGSGLVWGERRCFVVEAVASVLALTRLPHLEIVVVYDVDTPLDVLERLRQLAGDRLVLVLFAEPFNFSAKCNVGFVASSGEVVVLLNDDVQAITEGFLEQLVAPLAEPGVGMTGARLLFANGRLQHGGHVYGNGHFGHAFHEASPDDPGLFAALWVNRECSGLTAACAALRRETYEEVGGLCEELPGNFNDVDFSHKVRSTGGRLLWLANVELYHFESQTRDRVVHPWEYDLVTRRWGIPRRDPFLPGSRGGNRIDPATPYGGGR